MFLSNIDAILLFAMMFIDSTHNLKKISKKCLFEHLKLLSELYLKLYFKVGSI